MATKEHWLAIVEGENRDPADTSSRSHVHAVWEVRISLAPRQWDTAMASDIR